MLARKESHWTCRAVPAGIAISPNRALLVSVSPLVRHSTRTTAHSLPRQQHSSDNGLSRNDLSCALVSSILSRKSPSDIVHALATQVNSMEAVLTTLYSSLNILEAYSPNLQDMWIEEMLGIATEVYL